MPIVRVDIPQWVTQEQRAELRDAFHGCIERTWFKEHIWVAVRDYTSKPDERTVIMTVEVREGRGHDKERAEALFDEVIDVLKPVVGTKPEELIVLCRKFGQIDCVSGGDELPALADATPDISTVRVRSAQAAE